MSWQCAKFFLLSWKKITNKPLDFLRKKVENIFRILNFNKYAFFRIKGELSKCSQRLKKETENWFRL